ncbi:MAG: TonB-dependent receptor plug domain-containing protein, partial [Pseudomonadota bacterium]
MKLTTGFISSFVLLFSSAAYAQDLTDMSFEDLLASDITSVAKRPQKAEEAAAAVAVLSQDDIRKTGATTLPELLRFVPGVEVAEIDANNAAVGARGFNWRFSNKLLVLIDGRSVYQSVLSGVLWDEQLVPVEDIDRIEVIRGPGATLYGANAVNGVINVVTKHAADTLGGLVTTQAGVTTTTEQFTGRFFGRQGMRLGDRGAMRLYVTGRDTPSLIDLDEQPINDGGRGIQTGFRLDWEPNAQDAFTLQGDYRTVDFDVSLLFTLPVGPDGVQTFETRDENEAVNLIGRWSRSFDTDSKLTVQAFYDSGSRTEFGADFNYETVDLDISHYFSWGDQFETLWGIGYRSIEDEVRGSDLFAFQEPRLRTDLFSGFVQQDVNLVGDRLRVSLGSKFEHNDFTGFEVQPSVRAIWLGSDWSVWGAVSRAVRTPSRFET